MAPPARQTKSAECALTTRAVFAAVVMTHSPGLTPDPAVGVKGVDRLQPPRLALLPLGLRPGDRLPIRCQHQARTGIGHFHPVAAGFVDVEEKGLLNRVLMWAGLDEDTVLEEDIGGPQNVLTTVERVGDVMEATLHAMSFARVGKIVALVRAG